MISPEIFGNFVAPFDRQLIDLAHEAGQRVVYHTCGGMIIYSPPRWSVVMRKFVEDAG